MQESLKQKNVYVPKSLTQSSILLMSKNAITLVNNRRDIFFCNIAETNHQKTSSLLKGYLNRMEIQ